MKKILSLMSIGVAFIIVLASFTSIVSAQSTIEERVAKLQDMRESIKDGDWYPGMILSKLITAVYNFIMFFVEGKWFPGVLIFSFFMEILFILWSLVWGPGPYW